MQIMETELSTSRGKLVLLSSHILRKMETASKVYRMMSMQQTLYRRKREQHLNNIFIQKNRVNALSSLLDRNTVRLVWTKNRTGRFYEDDAQQNGENFFKENFRMNRGSFDLLCSKLICLQKQDTPLRKCIPLKKRVAVALYALGSSAEYRTIANLFGVGKSTVCEIVMEFCQEVWRVLKKEYLNPFPLHDKYVKECIKGMESLGFPQCFGAIDGCHIEVSPKSDDAVDYFNYKGWYSTVLFACVDYRYRFQYISVGHPGRCNDSMIFENSKLKRALQTSVLKQNSKIICGTKVPVLLIGDSAFRLSDTVMKPYPFRTDAPEKEKCFNYALSKTRRVVENAFGHLKARFRRIGKGVDNHIDNVSLVIKACCVLHNFLNNHNDTVNQHWLQQLNEKEQERNRQMPENKVMVDNNPSAQLIRQAIAIYLEAGCPDEDADVDDDGVAGISDALGSFSSHSSFMSEM